jgi:cytochrome d ubiquinol oxidase subunit II
MIDYAVLKVVWWMLIGLVLMLYGTTAGYDLGITVILPFLKKESHKRLALNISGPTWDGNQTWLVFAGGGLFVVWPVAYALSFSGFYAAILMILWPFFLRPLGYDYRGKIDNPKWRRFWDWGLFVSSFLPVVVFGVAFGNLLQGVPFYFDPKTMQSFYTGNFAGLMNPFGILCGLVSASMIIMHGASWLARRSRGDFQVKARGIQYVLTWITLVLFLVAGWWLMTRVAGYTLVSQPAVPTQDPLHNVVTSALGAWTANYVMAPWKYYPIVIAFLGLVLTLIFNRARQFHYAFWSSVFSVSGIIGTAGATLFPFLMPSSTHAEQSLTVWNAVSSQYALNTMLYVGGALLVIILIYKLFAFKAAWGKLENIGEEDLEENKHSFY